MRWPHGWRGGNVSRGIVWNWRAGIFWQGKGEESSPEEILLVIHRLVHLLPREYLRVFRN
jgi:hypothetical protein